MSSRSNSRTEHSVESFMAETTLRAVWKTVFGDSDEFIDLYFSRRYPNAKTFISLQDGHVAAQAQCFLYQMTAPIAEIIYPSGSKPGYGQRTRLATIGYVSGLATLPQFRRKGHAANVMMQLHQWLQAQRAEYCLLIPADEIAAKWYSAHFGYLQVARTEQYMINEQELRLYAEHCELTPEIISLIQRDLASTPYTIQHSAQDLLDQLSVCKMSGGGLFIACESGATRSHSLLFMAEKITLPDETKLFRVLDTFLSAPENCECATRPTFSFTKNSSNCCMYLPICNPHPLPAELRLTLMLE